jgi:copper chaperone CopZ
MSIANIMIRKASGEKFHRATNALNALTGVENAAADPGTNMITVAYDDEQVNLRQLRKTVQAHGIDVLSEWQEPL